MSARGEHIDGGVVIVSCPNCGAEGYEVDDLSTLVAEVATVSIPCDECDKRIEVFVDVHVQAVAAEQAVR